MSLYHDVQEYCVQTLPVHLPCLVNATEVRKASNFPEALQPASVHLPSADCAAGAQREKKQSAAAKSNAVLRRLSDVQAAGHGSALSFPVDSDIYHFFCPTATRKIELIDHLPSDTNGA